MRLLQGLGGVGIGGREVVLNLFIFFMSSTSCCLLLGLLCYVSSVAKLNLVYKLGWW